MMLQPGVICPAVCFYDAGGYTLTIRPTAFTIGLIIHFFIALFYVYTKLGIDSVVLLHFPESAVFNFAYNV